MNKYPAPIWPDQIFIGQVCFGQARSDQVCFDQSRYDHAGQNP